MTEILARQWETFFAAFLTLPLMKEWLHEHSKDRPKITLSRGS